MDDTQTLAQRIEARRYQLAIYRAAYAETYGRQLDAGAVEARDPVLRELLGERFTPGTVVAVRWPDLPEDTTGTIVKTFDGWCHVVLDQGGATYQLPLDAVELPAPHQVAGR